MALSTSETDQAGREPLVAVVDSQRLRRDAIAAALSLRGLLADSSERPPPNAALLVLQEDTVDLRGSSPTALPYLLIASSQASGPDRERRRQARAVLPNGSTLDDLVSAVRAVLAGGRPVFVPGDVGSAVGQDAARRMRSLSPRERSILVELASGRQNQEIGTAMGISSNTVRTHVQNIFGKLHVSNRGAAVAVGRRAGLRLDGHGTR